MRKLTLVCECGKTKTFRGPDAADIIRQIDDSGGWQDFPDDEDHPLPRGQQPGRCPVCLRKREEALTD